MSTQPCAIATQLSHAVDPMAHTLLARTPSDCRACAGRVATGSTRVVGDYPLEDSRYPAIAYRVCSACKHAAAAIRRIGQTFRTVSPDGADRRCTVDDLTTSYPSAPSTAPPRRAVSYE